MAVNITNKLIGLLSNDTFGLLHACPTTPGNLRGIEEELPIGAVRQPLPDGTMGFFFLLCVSHLLPFRPLSMLYSPMFDFLPIGVDFLAD